MSPRAAAIGGVVAGAIWMVAGWAFALFVQGATSYTAIYSAFASLILFIIWLDVNWLILLIGAAIAFYCQHPEYSAAGRRPDDPQRALARASGAGGNAGDRRGLLCGRAAAVGGRVAHRLRVPHETVMRVLNALITARLLATTKDEPPRFLPARPLETTPLKTLLDAVRAAGERSGLELGRIAADQPVLAVETASKRRSATPSTGCDLKDLVVAETGPDINLPILRTAQTRPLPSISTRRRTSPVTVPGSPGTVAAGVGSPAAARPPARHHRRDRGGPDRSAPPCRPPSHRPLVANNYLQGMQIDVEGETIDIALLKGEISMGPVRFIPAPPIPERSACSASSSVCAT